MLFFFPLGYATAAALEDKNRKEFSNNVENKVTSKNFKLIYNAFSLLRKQIDTLKTNSATYKWYIM